LPSPPIIFISSWWGKLVSCHPPFPSLIVFHIVTVIFLKPEKLEHAPLSPQCFPKVLT
jgi:hypothetical protein